MIHHPTEEDLLPGVGGNVGVDLCEWLSKHGWVEGGCEKRKG